MQVTNKINVMLYCWDRSYSAHTFFKCVTVLHVIFLSPQTGFDDPFQSKLADSLEALPHRQLCQLLILIQHPVWAFPPQPLEAEERHNVTLLELYLTALRLNFSRMQWVVGGVMGAQTVKHNQCVRRSVVNSETFLNFFMWRNAALC